MPTSRFKGMRVSGILRTIWRAGFLWSSLVLAEQPPVSTTDQSPATPTIEARLSEKQRATEQLEMLGFPPNGEAFIRTIVSAHRPLIDLYLAAGVDPNTTDGEGHTALLAASLSHDWDLVSRLLEAGADPKKADPHGVTPLMAAATAGQISTISALREHGADPLAADENGRTVCHYAIAARQIAVLQQLLDSGVPLPGPDRDGHTLASLAFETNDRPLIDLVLARQAGRVPWDAAARAAFAAAITQRDISFGKLILSKFAGDPAPDNACQPLLAYAVARDDRQQLDTLLDCGANPNVILDKPSDSVFHDLLPANFIRFYVEREPGMTALDVAAGLNRVECVKILLDKGANKNLLTSKSHFYALYFAAWAESPEALQILLGNAPSRDETRIEISLANQRATFIKDGVQILSSEISTGRAGFGTKPGDYVITDKHLEHHSTLYHNASMPFFMRLSFQAFGLHEGYVTGRPASHGCIRLPGDVARRLFKEAPVGTWVSITH
jgi:ankyrin repeat protein